MHMSVYEFRFNGHSMQYKVKLCIYLVLYCSSMISKLSKRICETELALSYYTDARALLVHGALYPSRSWKNTVQSFSGWLSPYVQRIPVELQ